MRTVVMLGLFCIAEAIVLASGVDRKKLLEDSDGFVSVVLLAAILMDLLEFLRNLFR